jgi:carbonic anhydrase
MKKLIRGILEFSRNLGPEQREAFAKLALGQKPDSLFVACSDSRVVPNLFASTDPGDLFVVRNVGNMIPAWGPDEKGSAIAAMEFAVLELKVKDIVICGHSECGAMQAILGGRDKVAPPHLKEWLRHGEGILEAKYEPAPGLAPHNRLSQENVLRQVAHLKGYSFIREAMEKDGLGIHGWWFDIAKAEVSAYDPNSGKFEPIAEKDR